MKNPTASSCAYGINAEAWFEEKDIEGDCMDPEARYQDKEEIPGSELSMHGYSNSDLL